MNLKAYANNLLREYSPRFEKLLGYKVEFESIESALNVVWFRAVDTKEYITGFAQTELPGCCGSMVLHDMSVIRNEEFTKLIWEFREDLARVMGYTMLMATLVPSYQQSTVNILLDRGWIELGDATFNNRRTYNEVHVYVKHINRKV